MSQLCEVEDIVTAWARQVLAEDSRLAILIIGETGVGKSTLINNILMKKVSCQGNTLESETKTIAKHKKEVNGVPVVVYDTPGLGDSRGVEDDKYLQEIKMLMDTEDISLVIHCMKMSETRIHPGLIEPFKKYSNIGIDWSHSIIALTFADSIPVSFEVSEDPNFSMSHFFNDKLRELREMLPAKLAEAGIKMEGVKIYPSTSHYMQRLPNGEEWYYSFWIGVIEVLSPIATLKYMKFIKDNIHIPCTDVGSAVGKGLNALHEESTRLPASTHITVESSITITQNNGDNVKLKLSVEQGETFNNILGKKIAEAVDIATGGMVGAAAATLTAGALVMAGTISAPVMIPAAAVGASAGAVLKWLGLW